jgi:thioredoxin reductase (NADPH)
MTEDYKPKRSQALVYYREVTKRKQLRIQPFETVLGVTKSDDSFLVITDKKEYLTKYVIIATGYYDNPNYLNIPGENLPKVSHYFKEAHPYHNLDVCVIGGKNSSVDATLELVKAGARVTVLYRGDKYSPSIKPWILPEFDALIRNNIVNMEFNAHLKEITNDEVIYEKEGIEKRIKNDFVFAMIGYHPDHQFLKKMGIQIDESTGRPQFDDGTMETNINGIYIAGVIAAGNNANEIFIENGRFHGGLIAQAILKAEKNQG